MTRNDLADFYENDDRRLVFHNDPETFYMPEKVAERQDRWATEIDEEENSLDKTEQYIMENFNKIG